MDKAINAWDGVFKLWPRMFEVDVQLSTAAANWNHNMASTIRLGQGLHRRANDPKDTRVSVEKFYSWSTSFVSGELFSRSEKWLPDVAAVDPQLAEALGLALNQLRAAYGGD